MAAIAGDLPAGYGGLPRPPVIPGTGFDGLVKSFAQLVKLVNVTVPYLARRLAYDVDRSRGTGLPIE